MKARSARPGINSVPYSPYSSERVYIGLHARRLAFENLRGHVQPAAGRHVAEAALPAYHANHTMLLEGLGSVLRFGQR